MNDEETKPIEDIEEDDVVTFEYNADGEEDTKATLKKLRRDLKDAAKEKQEYLTNWQRERADFVNYKKDEEARKIHLIQVARENVIRDLLPTLDSYDMAFSNKEAWEKVDKNWRMGVEYIHQQILKVLADYGVTEIAPAEGGVFDPHLHQPIESIETSDSSKDQTIAGVIQKGYRTTDNKVIRPARVNVFSASK